jgi:nitrite reductase/ring-hydroxylating ferredoxin subunit
MSDEKTGWVDAGALEALPVGTPTRLKHADQTLALIRLPEGGVRALDDQCPHEGYPLSQGTVDGDQLTCCYHNWKFDLADGSCPKGEAVRVHPARVVAGRVEVQVQAPDRARARARAWRSLEEGLLQRRDGQVTRDVVRLLGAGVTPTALALAVARFDAEYGEWGPTHVLPTAVDALAMSATAADSALPLLAAFELAAESHVRRPRRPTHPAYTPTGDRRSAFLAAVEAERVAEVEGIVRGALAEGVEVAEVAGWLRSACAAHFLDFGHALIYVTKALELLAQTQGEAETLLPALAVGITHGTREDLLPPWRWWQQAMDTARPHFSTWRAANRGRGGPSDEGLVALLLGADRRAAFEGVALRLADGVGEGVVVDALVAAAATRVMRFDAAHDADDTVQEGWLDVSHTLTFAHAVRHALAQDPGADLVALLFQATRFIQNAGALDGAMATAEASGDLGDALAAGEASGDLGDALAAGDMARAMGLVAAYDGPIDALRATFDAAVLTDRVVRPIVVVHLIKTTAAAFAEHALTGDRRPLMAAARLAAAPVRQRWVGRRLHEARRLVDQGKVPRTLT